jgi:hypothetical protein
MFIATHRRARVALALLAGLTLVLTFGVEGAQAKGGGGGGTAKPPKGVPPPVVPSFPAVPAPTFTADVNDIHQFDVTGFIQDMSVVQDDAMCPGVTEAYRGGSIKVNGLTITVPCNSVVQMPANTLTWAEVNDNNLPDLSTRRSAYPSFEAHVVGNLVGGTYVAGLVYLSQQGANSGHGVIANIDYSDGTLTVAGGLGQDGSNQALIRINDPNGRFGLAHSPDSRFSVDDENPTIKAGTGYPMCVPRKDPNAPDGEDSLCPQRNRPKVDPQQLNKGCRNFTNAGVSPLPASGELSAPAAGQVYCGHFVMEDPALIPAGDTTRPDARQQAPFEIGDHISYAGTLMKEQNGNPDYISAHTIDANVGIFTQPGTQPSYLAIGEFGVGAADPLATAINGAAQETQDRIFLEADTTDVKSVVDIYLVDVDPKTGTETNRWVTPFQMTGEQNGPALDTLNNPPMGGGITTQFTGPQSQRARIRATKAPAGLLSSPTRNVRVAVRSLCTPTDVNKTDVPVNGTGAPGPCLESRTYANGLHAGQYFAPTFEYIFPENTSVGDPVVPNNLWQLGFLINGEGTDAGGPGRLTPTPW